MNIKHRYNLFLVVVATLLCIAPLLYGVYLECKRHEIIAKIGVEEWVNPILDSLYKRCNNAEYYGRDAISEYDNIFKSICYHYGHDWLLLSAIAAVESHFSANAHSHAGARGLMQIMPRTAAIYGYDHSDLFDPHISIEIANQYLHKIEDMLMLPDSITYKDKLSLSLAAYNGGIGRIYDAQRLARVAGSDPHSWDQLKYHLLQLRDEEYYTRPEVRYGQFTGARSTLAYVQNVLNKYNEFQDKTKHSPEHLLPMAQY